MEARSDQALGASAQALAEALRIAGHRIAIAESCTGGLLSKLLTDLPGSSAWFERGIISYSNLAKQDLLGVSPATIERFGAVSAPVVMEMVSGLLARAPVHWALAVSGIAGPDGGTAEKPVGTVWIAFAGVNISVSASRFQFPGERDAVRRSAAEMSFRGLLELVKGVGG